MSLEGHCFCGSVKYTLKNKPEEIHACLCRDCQITTGTAYSIDVTVQKTDFEYKGFLKSYSSKADSGNTITRHFCPECGTQIYSNIEGKDKICIAGGTMKNFQKKEFIGPTSYIYSSVKPDWFQIPDGVKTFPEMPSQ